MAWKTKLQIEIDKNYTENVRSHIKEQNPSQLQRKVG